MSCVVLIEVLIFKSWLFGVLSYCYVG